MKIFTSKSKVGDPVKEKKKETVVVSKSNMPKADIGKEEGFFMERKTPKRGFSGGEVHEGDFGNTAAPRVGGKVTKSATGMAQGTSSKKVMKKSIKKAKRSAGSYQAKAAAVRALKSKN